jgi:Ca-activated chloride channel family protein
MVTQGKGAPTMRPILSALVASAVGLVPAHAQETCTRDAMVVFDVSGSMAEMGFNLMDEPRIFDARRAVRTVMPQVAPVRRIGLVTYGFGRQESCASVVVRFPPQNDAADRIISEIDRLHPAGETPLTEAIAAAAQVLEYETKPGEIVLVTDGKETCGGSPCQLAADLAAGADMTVHVIGFRVRGEHFAWPDQPQESNIEPVARCLADRTGGLYVDAETLDDLIGALRQTLGCQMLSAVTSGRPATRGAL